MNALVRTFGALNRFWSAANTSWNPEFVISNAIRDLQEAAVIGSQHDTNGLIAAVVKDWPKAMKGAFKAAFDKNAKGEWAGWYRRFSAAGGRVYFNQVEDISAIRKRIDRALAKNDALSLRTVGARALDLIERTNLAVENAVRVAFFKNAIEAGMSEEQAAAAAKNLTVNFNKQGERGALINSFYLFANAGIQGQTNLVLAAVRSARVRKLLGGLVLLGLSADLLNAFVSGDDDDGEKYYDKIGDFDKQRNLTIMLPNGKDYVKLPLGYGIGTFPALGRSIGEVLRGKKPTEVSANLMEAIIDSWNPIGGNNSILNFLAPTALDPVVDLVRNRDFADRPIMPDERQFGPQVPDSQRYWQNVGRHWKAVTDFLNRATGGDEVRPGAIDVSPETLEYAFGVVTGAAGATLDRVAGIPGKALQGELTVNDVPFARKVLGSEPTWYGKATFYERASQVEQAVHDYRDYRTSGDNEGANRMAESDGGLLNMGPAASRSRQALAALRRERLAVSKELTGDAKRERLETIKEREREIVNAFNRRWNESIGRADGKKVEAREAA